MKHTPPVALFTRAWIEIEFDGQRGIEALVALFTRAWIEIIGTTNKAQFLTVALFTRAWIEMGVGIIVKQSSACRPLHEGVD